VGEVRNDLNTYLESLVSSPVRSLEELIQWNKDHPEAQAGLGKPRPSSSSVLVRSSFEE
jgi:hypothetical protein